MSSLADICPWQRPDGREAQTVNLKDVCALPAYCGYACFYCSGAANAFVHGRMTCQLCAAINHRKRKRATHHEPPAETHAHEPPASATAAVAASEIDHFAFDDPPKNENATQKDNEPDPAKSPEKLPDKSPTKKQSEDRHPKKQSEDRHPKKQSEDRPLEAPMPEKHSPSEKTGNKAKEASDANDAKDAKTPVVSNGEREAASDANEDKEVSDVEGEASDEERMENGSVKPAKKRRKQMQWVGRCPWPQCKWRVPDGDVLNPMIATAAIIKHYQVSHLQVKRPNSTRSKKRPDKLRDFHNLQDVRSTNFNRPRTITMLKKWLSTPNCRFFYRL